MSHYLTTASLHTRPYLVSILFAVCLWLVGTTQVLAQVSLSTVSGGTPPGLSPGAPAGAYPLSGFENINIYNGHLSLSFPLLTIGGRGEARYTPVLRISAKPWIVNANILALTPSAGWYWSQYAVPEFWQPNDPGYGPGVMYTRPGGKDPHVFSQADPRYVYNDNLTRLTFTAADGTEYEFIDQYNEGQYGGPGGGRGRVWTTRDSGISATFVSDTDSTLSIF